MTSDLKRKSNVDAARLFLMNNRFCQCGCNRYADCVRPPAGWRAKAMPQDRNKWRALSHGCAAAERPA